MKEVEYDVPVIKIRRWPSPQDYNEAVQTPLTSFADSDLKNGAAEQNDVGLPRPRSGNFATVYKFTCQNRNWAVRCFLSCTPRQQERYQAIESALTPINSKLTVGFDYIEDGISIAGSSYPILKMEWAEGTTLDEYVHSNLANGQKLSNLAQQIKDLNLLFRKHGIAHGDLQHGNILVTDSAIKIVDYDGMYVPELAGEQSPELGHRNYQHPARTSADYGASLDNFSAWVIYVSLICLVEDSTLWWKLGAGDDQLLFAQADFDEPAKSHTFFDLEHHANEKIRQHAKFLRGLLSLKINEIPFLDAEVLEPSYLPELIEEMQYSKAEEKTTATETPVIIKNEKKLPSWQRLLGFVLWFFIVSRFSSNHIDLSSLPSTDDSLEEVTESSAKPGTLENDTEAQKLEKQAQKASYDGATRFAIDLQKQAIAAYQKEYSATPTAKQTRQLAICWHDLALYEYRIYDDASGLQAIEKAIELYTKANDKKGLQEALVDRKVNSHVAPAKEETINRSWDPAFHPAALEKQTDGPPFLSTGKQNSSEEPAKSQKSHLSP